MTVHSMYSAVKLTKSSETVFQKETTAKRDRSLNISHELVSATKLETLLLLVKRLWVCLDGRDVLLKFS